MIDKKKYMKPGDYHWVVSTIQHTGTMFTSEGKKLFTIPALCEGQHDNWKAPRGDTPPGFYKFGTVYTQDESNMADLFAYGEICIDMIDLEGQETGNGRAGISAHGGGTALANPLSAYQPLIPTHGCIRVHNNDLKKTLAPLVVKAKKEKRTVFVSVVDRV